MSEPFQPGEPVQVLTYWAHGEPPAWFPGYTFDRYEGETSALVRHDAGIYAGQSVRYRLEQIRKVSP